jgi:hypothetical protein
VLNQTAAETKSTEKMSAIAEASLTPLLDLLSVKGGDTSGTAGSIVGHVTAEPSLAPLLCVKLGEQVACSYKLACRRLTNLKPDFKLPDILERQGS